MEARFMMRFHKNILILKLCYRNIMHSREKYPGRGL